MPGHRHQVVEHGHRGVALPGQDEVGRREPVLRHEGAREPAESAIQVLADVLEDVGELQRTAECRRAGHQLNFRGRTESNPSTKRPVSITPTVPAT
jgi:hypothetical protein